MNYQPLNNDLKKPFWKDEKRGLFEGYLASPGSNTNGSFQLVLYTLEDLTSICGIVLPEGQLYYIAFAETHIDF